MKHIFRLIFLLLVFSFLFSAFSESSQDETDLKNKNEQRVFKCLNTLTAYLVDDCGVYGTTNEFVRGSKAWDYLSGYDGGWFPASRSKTVSNLRTDGWEKVSDTQFCVNVYCDYEIKYLRDSDPVNYPCSYHFCFTQTDARKDIWMVKDLHVVQNPDHVAFAEKITSENEGITLTAITGPSFSGYMMIIDDPSRVFVGTIARFRSSTGGLRIDEIVKRYDALGGINGGGFDEGKGGSSRPFGILYTMGERIQPHTPTNALTKILIGFDKDNKLHVGKYTQTEAEALNLRDALGFGPALIIEGKSQETGRERSDYSSRAAIGQDADGRVLMLIVRGRHPNSIGANMKDLIKIMEDFGAVNAGNLDGGHSAAMYFDETIVYSGYRFETSRTLPTGFLIKKLPE